MNVLTSPGDGIEDQPSECGVEPIDTADSNKRYPVSRRKRLSLMLTADLNHWVPRTNGVREVIQLVGKFTGVVSGVGACASWTIAMWTPTPALPLSGMAFAVALLMAMLAIVTVIASVHGHGITLIVLFFASFFPVGLFLLEMPSWVRVIGVLNLGYLIAGLVAWRMPRAIVKI